MNEIDILSLMTAITFAGRTGPKSNRLALSIEDARDVRLAVLQASHAETPTTAAQEGRVVEETEVLTDDLSDLLGG